MLKYFNMVSEIAELFEPNCTLHSHYQGRISIGGERIKDNIGLDKTTPVKEESHSFPVGHYVRLYSANTVIFDC
jgi:hypothetical protein